jgi:hypothetical protein
MLDAHLGAKQKDYLICSFFCPCTSFLWRKFNVLSLQGLQSVQGSITNPRLVNPAQSKDWATIFIAIIWNIWLARNKKAFDNALIPVVTMETNCCNTISLWVN